MRDLDQSGAGAKIAHKRRQELIAQKRDQGLASTEALANEETRAATLAQQATNLKDLVSRMESEVRSAAAASAAADKAAGENSKAAKGVRVAVVFSAER